VDHDEPLDVFINFCFVGFVRPLRHRGLTVFGGLTRARAVALCRHESWVFCGKDNERVTVTGNIIPGPVNRGSELREPD
jgi:hypothetical protein